MWYKKGQVLYTNTMKPGPNWIHKTTSFQVDKVGRVQVQMSCVFNTKQVAFLTKQHFYHSTTPIGLARLKFYSTVFLKPNCSQGKTIKNVITEHGGVEKCQTMQFCEHCISIQVTESMSSR